MTRHKRGNMFAVLADDYEPPERPKKVIVEEYPRFPDELPEQVSCSSYTPPKLVQIYYRRKWDKRVTRDIFRQHCLAKHNAIKESPERITTPFHIEMIKNGWMGYHAQKHHLGGHYEDTWRHPVWSFHRYGRSRTVLEQDVETSCIGTLPQGTKLFIGGYHEEFCDFDYFIYSDVTVVKPDGTIELLQYHTNDFPPTDGHTATLLGHDTLILIGSIGYLDARGDKAQVCVLNLNTMKCQVLTDTKGDDPGWISKHSAEHIGDGRILITVSVPDWTKMRNGCRPGRWIFDTQDSSWSALPLTDDEIAQTRQYEDNIKNGVYDTELRYERINEGNKESMRDTDDLLRQVEDLVKMEENYKEIERLLKELKEQAEEYTIETKQYRDDKRGLRSLTDARERKIEEARLKRIFDNRADRRKDIRKLRQEIDRLCDLNAVLSKECRGTD
ncbi:uncharacterized protein EV422DRAFT_535304 [Fimicolochytrium jonesii]|uniref:uncharacterized protein n=1 Tax=Fimicolochytrium jonesii TaxID=1396493 RepID=UPI0022FED087|nr:uncharacterized protein EV422DRAFT_535304 [Fimicolochytrium jonesii]KAI8819153.1 hypothetical protein EV422DRAFT_535304 [Fimicolochytrium jonesii]